MLTATNVMLTYEQQRHFADHGWLLLANVLDEDQCRAYIAALDHCTRTRRSESADTGGEVMCFGNLELVDEIFIEWLRLPRILAANRQLLGTHLRFWGTSAHIKPPHPDRATRAEELMDPDRWGWHRALRPKWGTFPHDSDPQLVNCALLNNTDWPR